MTPSSDQIDSYDAEPLLEVARQLKILGTNVDNLFQRYVDAVTVPEWHGLAAEAVHERAASDRKTAYSLIDALEAVASRLETGYWDVHTKLGSARHLIASAEESGFVVPRFGALNIFASVPLGVVHPWGTNPTPAREAARIEWDRQVTAAANEVETSDTHLREELSALTATLSTQFKVVSEIPQNEQRFRRAEDFIFDEMKRNSNSDIVKDIRATRHEMTMDSFSRAYHKWFEMVKTDGVWDHKPRLTRDFELKGDPRTDPDFFFQQPGTHRQVNYDIYSNIHYGYVGRAAGITTFELINGAAVFSQHDEGDAIAMRAGAALYDKYGPNITAEQFHRGVIDTIDDLERAHSESPEDVPQIQHNDSPAAR